MTEDQRKIIESQQAEEELRASQARLTGIVNSAMDAIITVDAEQKVLLFNTAAEKMFRCPASEAIGQSLDLFIPERYRATHSSHIEEMIGRSALEFFDAVSRADMERRWQKRVHGIKEQYDLCLRRKDGSDLWVIVSATPIRDEHGEFTGALSMLTDITERKHAERELMKSEERYRDLVENAHDIIYSHDLEGNYTSINTAGEQITGYTPEESLRMNLAQTVAPEYLEKARPMLARKLSGEHVTAYELEIVAKDGRRIAIEVNTKPIRQDGVPVGVQGIARDVTERKQLEAQLRQSQKLEAIGQLAGGIAHDFNNLLTAINGYSELTIMRLQTEDPLRRNIEEIKKAGERAALLTRQLLAFSRKQVLQPKVININSIVSDMEKMLRRLIGEDVGLKTFIASELGSIKADPGQIEQVLMNLAVNARDAMPHGGKLTIEAENVYLDEDYARQHIAVKPGSYVMLAVSDTGTGMDEQTQAHIFEPFFTTKAADKGTGLGLSTVYLDEGANFIQKPFSPNALAQKVRAVLSGEERGH